MKITDLPRFAREELGLYGLNIATDLLAGADLKTLDLLRESADRSSCPLLVLIEPESQAFTHPEETRADAAVDRMHRVVKAAHRLGCNAAAFSLTGPDSDDAFEDGAERIKRVLGPAERMEVNLLLSAGKGFTREPDRLTDLIKKVGGFRIGTFPDFHSAYESGNAPQYLRRLTPYASALTAVTLKFKEQKKGGPAVHEPYDLAEYVKIILSVGYSNTIAIEFRGADDPLEGVRLSKLALESALGREKPPEPAAVAEDEEVPAKEDDASE